MANNSSKQFLSIIALIAGLLNAQAFGACDQVVCASVVKAEKICTDVLVVKSDCGACHTISAKDFMDAEGNLSQTVVIDQPGRWCLCENINFNPTLDAFAQPAIQILVSDVHLDLGEYTLRQTNTSVQDIYGVQIGEGFLTINPELQFNNITVTNGSINNFSGVGIFSYNSSLDSLEVPFAYESFTFKNLNILNCGTTPSLNYLSSGLYLDSAADITVYDPETIVSFKNVIVENCSVNNCLGNGAICIVAGDNVVIKNTQANNLTNEISGIGITAGYNLLFVIYK